jgi:ABC-type polysaccharide/polyol phosphate export permease
MLRCDRNGKVAARRQGTEAAGMRDATGQDISIPAKTGAILSLIYHATVRSIRRGSGNALMGLIMNIFQTVLLILTFWVMMSFFGLRGVGLRGDFTLFLMTGVFLYMTNIKAVGAVAGAEGPTSPMMLHAPMSTAVSIASAALASLYVQVLSITVVLYAYHAFFTPITIEDPASAFGMLLLSWAFGVSVGMVLLAARPWWPSAAGIVSTVYSRANMIASGKMTVANTLPFTMMSLFIWNPLFHLIDQCRGYVFLNYNPHYTSYRYAIYVTLALFVIGLMGEFFTRRHASLSWGAGK